jgi:hypothetical protein
MHIYKQDRLVATAHYNSLVASPEYARPVFVLWLILLFAATISAQERRPVISTTPPVGKKDHRATLNWAPSPDAGKAGSKMEYAVYRSNGARKPGAKPTCAGAFSKIAQIDGSITIFVDNSVLAEHVYCYQIKSVVGKAEGAPSETVLAVIPGDEKTTPPVKNPSVTSPPY